MTDHLAERRVYAVLGVPPEVQAYALARYSRSSQSMLESIEELSQQRAEKFLNAFYFQYGHRSIADLAHLVLALENISILAAIKVVDEPVWDGQERSTRYQNFRRSGYFVPPALAEQPALAERYRRSASALFAAYEGLSVQLLELLEATVPRPPDMDESQYARTLRARAFDVARALLPLATHTSVGQVVSARVLERQISRLCSDPYPEVREIGAELRAACLETARAPLWRKVIRDQSLPAGALDALVDLRAAPTLVKYAQPSPYLQQTYPVLEQAARELLGDLGAPDRARVVELAEPEGLEDELLATLLYRADRAGHSYRQVQAGVRTLSAAQKREVVELSLAHRGGHDELLREHQVGYALKFDVLIDLGSFRDLHRHRRCVQIQQPLSADHGAAPAEQVFRAGLGPAAERPEAGVALQAYARALQAAEAEVRALEAERPLEAVYLLPLAARCRCLFKMDLAEAAYIVELRTAPAGHFSYRHAAWQMFRELERVYPSFAAGLRAVDPNRVVDLLRR
ncbi:MAG: FAD-dependent thymidylate synthase [Chloroflexi bacterium]|nr:FAD-dependent thymidylate synthase [Chloroflexota bacterium]